MRGLLFGRVANKKKLLARLHNFKLKLQWELEAGIAKRLYEENCRKTVSIKVPKMPSREVQDHHNLTHIAFELCWKP